MASGNQASCEAGYLIGLPLVAGLGLRSGRTHTSWESTDAPDRWCFRSGLVPSWKSGQQCLLADALITQGIALARLGRTEVAQFAFQRAIEVAQPVDALK